MKRSAILFMSLLCMVIFFVAGCGSGDGDVKGESEELTSEKGEEAVGDNKGVLVAKEILATYDMAVAEISAAAGEKPAVDVLKQKLEAVYAKFTPVMAELNKKYLALKDEDIALFGDANGYLGENRGKHVFKKDNDLGEFINHYSYTDKSEEIVKLLKDGLFKLLETAVKR